MALQADPTKRKIADRRLIISAFFTVLTFRVALWIVPYRRIRRWIPQVSEPRPDSRFYARYVAYRVRTASRWVTAASCLTQALAAQYLLARSGHRSTIRIGVRRGPDGASSAHAWLLCEGLVVLGGNDEDLSSYVPLTDLG